MPADTNYDLPPLEAEIAAQLAQAELEAAEQKQGGLAAKADDGAPEGDVAPDADPGSEVEAVPPEDG